MQIKFIIIAELTEVDSSIKYSSMESRETFEIKTLI